MDEPFLPWWLLLLLGMWAAAVTVWRCPSLHREIRFWAGLSSLAYLALIFFALGLGPRTTAPTSSSLIHTRTVNAGLVICVVTSLASSVWVLGQISPRSRRLCYLVLTLSNACFCWLVQSPEIAAGLLLYAALSAKPLVQEWHRTSSRSSRDWLFNLIQLTNDTAPHEKSGQFWLVGAMSGILTCVLIGTLAYSLRIETLRTSTSPRYSALPSRDLLDRIHSRGNGSANDTALLDMAFGQRADLVVLMATIVFICLAITLNEPQQQITAVAETQEQPSSENPL